MPMAATEIERLIKESIPDAQVTIRDLAGDGDGAPALTEAGRVESRDERDLQPEVQNDGEDHAADDRDGDVPPRPGAGECGSILRSSSQPHAPNNGLRLRRGPEWSPAHRESTP